MSDINLNLKPFDAGRAMLQDYADGYPARLEISDGKPLLDALAAGTIQPDTRLLTFQQGDTLYAFPMQMVLSYNVIQGQLTNHKPWMMTFCNACNTGMVFDPVLNERILHFRRRGAYDGLLLIWDEETNSYWQHITGECLLGSSQGKRLTQITTTRQMTAAEAVVLSEVESRKALLLHSPLTPEQERLSRVAERMRDDPSKFGGGILETIGKEDTRRPRFELGLGVWNDHKSIFFPLVMLHMYDNALITSFDGRNMVVYITEEAISPVAAYVDSKVARWDGGMLKLDRGAHIQNDVLYGEDGKPTPLVRPTQLLMRWYGFALTFPKCIVPEFE